MLPDGYLLRTPTLDDAASLASTLERNRGHMGPWDPDRPASFYTAEGQRASLTRQLDGLASGSTEPWLLLAGDEVVGGYTLNQIVRMHVQSAILGYWVDEQHTRRGLAGAMVDHAAARGREIGLHRVEAGTHVDNHPSQGVLRKAGFEEVGVARGLLFIGGGWADHRIFQLLLHDDPLST